MRFHLIWAPEKLPLLGVWKVTFAETRKSMHSIYKARDSLYLEMGTISHLAH